jgi:hypothetical protein
MTDLNEQKTQAVQAAFNEAIASQVTGKSFWKSKTFWANIVAAGAVLVQMRYGFVIGLEYQAIVLSGVNMVLRAITHEPVSWK